MKTIKKSNQGWRGPLVSLAFFALVGGSTYAQAAGNSVIGQTHKLASESTCPLPEAEQDATDPSVLINHKGKCVLNSDVVLDQTVELGAFTTLDCRGHKISALAPSNPLLPTTADDATASNPEVGILMKGALGVTIQNCVIEGFDFGIAVYDAKTPIGVDDPASQELLGIKIVNNTVSSKSLTIMLDSVDKVQLTGNQLNLISTGALGIRLVGDSDNNLISDNTVTRIVSGAPITIRRSPGRFSALATNPQGIVIMKRRALATEINIIGGEVVNFDTYMPDAHISDNVIENNRFDMSRGTITNGNLQGIQVAEGVEGTIIRGNTFKNAVIGILQGFGGPVTETFAGQLPSTCSGGAGSPGPAGRACKAIAECYIPELGDTAAGTCSLICNSINPTYNGDSCSTNSDCGTGGACGFTANAMDDPRTSDTVIEDNVVLNCSGDGISAQEAQDSLTISGNSITGASGASHGINLGGTALNGGTLVTRNSLSSNGNGLFLTNPVTVNLTPPSGPVTSFVAQMTLNDITGSTAQAIGRTAGYTLNPTELSVLGSGNYWGRTSCPGFVSGVDSPALFITDSNPYITPVAATGTGTQCP